MWVRPRPLLLSPIKWEMHELHRWFSISQAIAYQYRAFIGKPGLKTSCSPPFLSTQYSSNLKQFLVHAAGDKGVDPDPVVMEVTGWNFSSGGISPDFPKLCKKITVQCELKLFSTWLFNFFCIWEGDSYGQSAHSRNQFFCSHPVPQALNIFHTKPSQNLNFCVQTDLYVLRYKTPHK